MTLTVEAFCSPAGRLFERYPRRHGDHHDRFVVHGGLRRLLTEIEMSRWCAVGGEHDVDRTEGGHQVQRVVLRPLINRGALEPGARRLGCVETRFEFVEDLGEAFEVLVIPVERPDDSSASAAARDWPWVSGGARRMRTS